MFADAMAKHYDQNLDAMVRRLRDLADAVDREGKPRKNFTRGDDERPDYVYAASQVVHAVTWAVANLDMPGLITAAEDVHHARDLPGGTDDRATA